MAQESPPPPQPPPHSPLPGGRIVRPDWRGWLGACPRPCVLCQQWGQAGFCRDCHQRFLSARPPRCPRCALPSAGGMLCGGCLRQPPPFLRCITLADYQFPWDRLIARWKFQQQPELSGLLADAWLEALTRPPTESAAEGPVPQCVLPVPLSPARLAERGYNQAWELARRLAARQGLPARTDALLRLRETPHQVGLGRAERQRNLRDAMWVPPAAQPALAGRHLALVDDVMTTGVTAAAATQALLAAGAASVTVWVLARTPEPGR